MVGNAHPTCLSSLVVCIFKLAGMARSYKPESFCPVPIQKW
jgi:hypothetical protein